jgi:hypothetical protein
MNSIYSIFKRTLVSGLVVVATAVAPALSLSPLAASAADCTAPPAGQNGVHWPVGSDAAAFTYQCDGPYAGLWTSAYYTFDPSTTQVTPLYAPDYAYDCTTHTWSMTQWDYSPAQSTYIKSRVTPATAPNLATGCPVVVPPTATAATTGTGSGSGPGASTTTTGTGDPATAGAATVSTTGPGSNNTVNGNIVLNTNNNTNNTLGMTNGINSQATTGNSFITGNTTAGSAATGDAQAIVNLANLLQSSSNVFGPNTVTFVSNINGDVNGDFMFDPAALSTISTTGPNSNNTVNGNLQINTNNNNNTTAQINNTVDVGANSGNATVASNTSGGDATTGSASAIANLMNLINSTVTAGKSFVGVVNINGNLNGDILLPQSFIDQLLASSGPNSNNTVNTNLTNNSTTTNNTTAGIGNNITSSAQSGSATVADNTSAGGATTGSAMTNVTLLNLTGSNVFGSNDLLVFVNVLGHWVGMIVNAPVGATAASLGGGITSTGPNSNNSLGTTATNNSNTTNNNNLGINNNVNVHANSGNALVADNTSGGNAQSGNANTAVNILNIAGTNLNLSNWFGVLFINVFGDWFGSFGVNTSAGDPVPTPAGQTAGTPTGASSPSLPQQFAAFVGRAGSGSGSTTGTTTEQQSEQTPAAPTTASTLGAHTSQKASTTVKAPTPDNGSHVSPVFPIIGASLAGAMLLGERLFTVRKSHKES